MTSESKPAEQKRKPYWDNDEPVTNPWVDVAPPCPRCDNTDIWLWHPSGTLRWYCYVCKRRFDPPSTKKKSKTRDALLQRESAKFPALGKVLGQPVDDQPS